MYLFKLVIFLRDVTSTSNFMTHYPLQPKMDKTPMDEDENPKRRRESFLATPIISKSLSLQHSRRFLVTKTWKMMKPL